MCESLILLAVEEEDDDSIGAEDNDDDNDGEDSKGVDVDEVKKEQDDGGDDERPERLLRGAAEYAGNPRSDGALLDRHELGAVPPLHRAAGFHRGACELALCVLRLRGLRG